MTKAFWTAVFSCTLFLCVVAVVKSSLLKEAERTRVSLGYVSFREQNTQPQLSSDHFSRLIRGTNLSDRNVSLTFKRLKPVRKPNLRNPVDRITNMCDALSGFVQPVYPHTERGLYNAYYMDSNEEAKEDQEDEMLRKLVSHQLHYLKIPQILNFAENAGRTQQEYLTLRLEPSQHHITEAMIDFLQEFGWNLAAVVVNRALPEYKHFLETLMKSVSNRSKAKGGRKFDITVTQVLDFDGITSLSQMKAVAHSPAVKRRYSIILQRILAKDDRIILFCGTRYDMMMYQFAVKANSTLAKTVGAGHMWLFTPRIVLPGYESSSSNDVPSIKAESFAGFFAFWYHYSPNNIQLSFDIAMNVWTKAVIRLLKEFDSDRISLENIYSVLNCSNLSTMAPWRYGERFFRYMQQASYTAKDGRIFGFGKDNYINSTKLLVLNSQNRDDGTEFVKVGEWRMDNTVGERRSTLSIDEVVWPGNKNHPPRGRPDRVKLRVATLQEKPFVIFQNVRDDGTCSGSSFICTVRRPRNGSSDGEVAATAGNSDKWTNVTTTSSDVVGRKDVGAVTAANHSAYADTPYIQMCCAGLAMDLLTEIAKDANLDIELFEVPDKQWGYWTKYGWTGLVGSLINRSADMVVTSFQITPNRSEQLDISVPFQETGINILVALREGAISPTAFLEPYDYASWCLILAFSVHACAVSIFIYEWLSPAGLDRGRISPPEHKFSLFRSLWLIWSMLFGAAVHVDNPRGFASRFLANIWALFALVFLASYTANLAAFMIAKEAFYDLDGINDPRLRNPWTTKPYFRFATVPGGSTEENIRLNFPKIADYMRSFNKTSVEEGISALKNGELDAFIYDSNILQYKSAHDDSCRLRVVGKPFAKTGYGIAFSKGAKRLQQINTLILKYQNNGLLQRWQRFWMKGACKTGELQNTNRILGVKNFISAFSLLVGGMILCSVLLCVEHFFYHYMRPLVKRVDKYGCCGAVSLSMGRLLSFEESVNKAVDMVKYHKCENPICVTQLWRTKNDLEEALKRIKRLELAIQRTEMLHVRIPTDAALCNSNALDNSSDQLNTGFSKSAAPVSATSRNGQPRTECRPSERVPLLAGQSPSRSTNERKTWSGEGDANRIANSRAQCDDDFGRKTPQTIAKQAGNPLLASIRLDSANNVTRALHKPKLAKQARRSDSESTTTPYEHMHHPQSSSSLAESEPVPSTSYAYGNAKDVDKRSGARSDRSRSSCSMERVEKESVL